MCFVSPAFAKRGHTVISLKIRIGRAMAIVAQLVGASPCIGKGIGIDSWSGHVT